MIINIEKTSLHIAFSDLTLETDNEITYMLFTFLNLVFKKYYESHFKLIIVFLSLLFSCCYEMSSTISKYDPIQGAIWKQKEALELYVVC